MSKTLLKVDIVARNRHQNFPDTCYIDWAKSAWLQKKAGHITIALLDEKDMTHLNQKFCQQTKPTDVLAFPADPCGKAQVSLTGDLAICEPVIEKYADSYGKALDEKTAHTIVHGVLHIQGYTHLDSADTEIMQAIERDILARMNYSDPYTL